MRTAIALTGLCLIAISARASGQSWREAYDRGELFAVPGTTIAQAWKLALERGDDAAAVRLLGSLVFEPGEIRPHPNEAEQLAILYHEGRGVPQDLVLACSLFDLAARSARTQSDWGHRDVRLETRREAMCGPLSPDERREAGRMMGCVTFGPDRQSYALDAGHWVDISRQGVRVHYDEADTLHDLPGLGCNTQFGQVRYTRVAATEEGRPRHFLEFFIAEGRRWPDESALPDWWQLVEVIGGSIGHRAMERLRNTPDRTSLVPAVRFETTDDGRVEWRFDDGRFSGAIEVLKPAPPPPPPPDVFPPVEPGSGRVDVTVVDRLGAPMSSVAVTLTGLVSRVLQTEATGTVSFVDLPDGRYDVVASLKGFPSSLPRVLDVAGLATSVEIVLKPSAAIAWSVFECGLVGRPDARQAEPGTLEWLAADADAIAHVKIGRQRSYRREGREEGDRGFIMTAATVELIESFKSSSPLTGGDEIVQTGGRLETADEIEVTTFNRFAQLNTGDEYVLFLKRYDQLGYVVIHHAPEGAFLIRNGRVRALGGTLAQTWKDRSAAKFFEALRTSLTASAKATAVRRSVPRRRKARTTR